MTQKRVRALQVCFIGGSLRKVGDEFLVPDDQPLRTKKLPPVMEIVEDDEPQTARRKPGRPRKVVPDEEATED